MVLYVYFKPCVHLSGRLLTCWSWPWFCWLILATMFGGLSLHITAWTPGGFAKNRNGIYPERLWVVFFSKLYSAPWPLHSSWQHFIVSVTWVEYVIVEGWICVCLFTCKAMARAVNMRMLGSIWPLSENPLLYTTIFYNEEIRCLLSRYLTKQE